MNQIEQYKINEKKIIYENEQYKQIVINLESKVNELDLLYSKEKERILLDHQNLVNKLKKDNKKIKDEKNKLIKLCSQLKIEVNRLENHLSITQNFIADANQIEVNNDFITNDLNSNDFLSFQSKKNTLLDNHDNQNIQFNDDVLSQVKATMNKALDYADKNIDRDDKIFIDKVDNPYNNNLLNSCNLQKDTINDNFSNGNNTSQYNKLKLFKRTKMPNDFKKDNFD